MKPVYRLLICAMTLWLAACATSLDAQHPMEEGWRVGHVDHEVALDESTPLVRFGEDCRDIPLPPQQTAPVRWAMLHFRRPPEEVFRIVPVWSDTALPEGQLVYVKVDDCAKPLALH